VADTLERLQPLLPSEARRHAALARQARRAPADAETDAVVCHPRIHIGSKCAIGAKLLPLSQLGLQLLLAIGAHLLTLGQACLGLLNPLGAKVLRLLDPVRAELLTRRHASLRVLTVRAHLLPFGHARLRLLAVRAHLLALSHARLNLLPLSAHLDALATLRPFYCGEALLPFHARRCEGLALHTGSGKCLPLHPRRSECALAPATAATCYNGSLTVPAASATAVRPRICRG